MGQAKGLRHKRKKGVFYENGYFLSHCRRGLHYHGRGACFSAFNGGPVHCRYFCNRGKGLKMQRFILGAFLFAAWVCLMLASFDVLTK